MSVGAIIMLLVLVLLLQQLGVASTLGITVTGVYTSSVNWVTDFNPCGPH